MAKSIDTLMPRLTLKKKTFIRVQNLNVTRQKSKMFHMQQLNISQY